MYCLSSLHYEFTSHFLRRIIVALKWIAGIFRLSRLCFFVEFSLVKTNHLWTATILLLLPVTSALQPKCNYGSIKKAVPVTLLAQRAFPRQRQITLVPIVQRREEIDQPRCADSVAWNEVNSLSKLQDEKRNNCA